MTLLYSEHRKFYIWNAIVVAATTWLTIYVPLGFQFDLSAPHGFFSIYLVSCGILLIDVFVRFQRHKKAVAENNATEGSGWSFLTSLGLIDVVSAIPYGLFGGVGILHALHLVKLIRVSQSIRQFKQDMEEMF